MPQGRSKSTQLEISNLSQSRGSTLREPSLSRPVLVLQAESWLREEQSAAVSQGETVQTVKLRPWRANMEAEALGWQ